MSSPAPRRTPEHRFARAAPRKPRVYIHVHPLGEAKRCFAERHRRAPVAATGKTSLFDPVAGEDIPPQAMACTVAVVAELSGVRSPGWLVTQQRFKKLTSPPAQKRSADGVIRRLLEQLDDADIHRLVGADEVDGNIRPMLSNTTMVSASPGVGLSSRQLCGAGMGPQQQGSSWTCGEERKALRPAPGAGRRDPPLAMRATDASSSPRTTEASSSLR
jgi:hypothetical protein